MQATVDEQGYAGPIRLFSPRECQAILASLRQSDQRPPLDWSKGWAATSPAYYAVAAQDRLLEWVTALIGGNVILWGISVVVRRPGQVHPWHTDIETAAPAGRTISVWIGLANTNARSSLKVVPRSHRFGVTLQQVMQEAGQQRDRVSDDDVAVWARARDRQSGVATLESADGDVVVFDGRLWHGSHNQNGDRTRYAVLLHYATPETAIRIPNLGRLTWPFEVFDTPKPACILVNGNAMNTPNRIVPAPVAKTEDGLPSLTSRFHPLRLPLERDSPTGWKPHHLFRGSTPDIARLDCHVSVLDPGRQPHPPHRHADEEILVVLDGEADLIWETGNEPGQVTPHRARRGQFAYYPAGFTHTIQNSSAEPVTYLMFKWQTDRSRQGSFLRQQLIRWDAADAGPGESMAPAEIWEALDISKQGALDLLRPLMQAGLIQRVGTKKSGRYILM